MLDTLDETTRLDSDKGYSYDRFMSYSLHRFTWVHV
jgi:hypothetical protein